MKYSNYFIPTLKETPAEAEVISHQLMLRAGMIRKLAAGIYSLLPMGLKVIRKIENIVRQEMNDAQAIEVLLPSIQPSELWKESGRWDVYGKELLRIYDRHQRDFCYGPTHEEVITDLVRNEVRSYRSLPINLYQIQTKFRDEIRPRFGVMRAREFIMKDAYSFDANDAGVEDSYMKMKRAYRSIFKRCGLKFRAVEADTGQIGGSFSHEFMVLAESGEDTIAFCDSCDYAANVEKVALKAPGGFAEATENPAIEVVDTPGHGTIEEVSEFLGESADNFIKTLVYNTGIKGKENIVVLCRGDHGINEVKLARAIGADEVTLADAETVLKVTGAPVGFAGPVGLTSAPILADNYVKPMQNGVTGANKKDQHLKNVNPERDFPGVEYADIRQPVEGDGCPVCDSGVLKLAKGIEVGHIFKLGVKYSEAMGATFLDAGGNEQPMIMGCYGIGIGRTAAAAIEQNHDDNGIIWPVGIAPFEVAVLPLQLKDEAVMKTAEDIYSELEKAGHEPILDDRDLRPGVKFNDADLLGFPVQVVIGKKSLADGLVEIKIRKSGERTTAPLSEAISRVDQILADLAKS